jgi:predicted aspartyl protease
MGKVIVPSKVENTGDIEMRERGVLPPEQVRSAEIANALVDTGAWGLMLPKSMVAQLGLRLVRTPEARGIGGKVPINIYSSVRLYVQDRDCTMDVGELPDGYPVLIGQLPLEAMDFVVDPKGQCLIGNPEHGGEWILDVF